MNRTNTITPCQAVYFCIVILLFSSCSLFSSEEVPGPTVGQTDILFIDSDPAWSPDGQWIVFSHGRASLQDSSKQGLFLIRPDGSGRQHWHEGGIPSGAPTGSGLHLAGADRFIKNP